MTPTEAQRLSEQEKILVSRCARGVASVAEGNELAALVYSLARQLAEAERENGRLKAQIALYKRPLSEHVEEIRARMIAASESTMSEVLDRADHADRVERVLRAVRHWREGPKGDGAERTVLWQLRDAIDSLDGNPPDPPAPPPKGPEAATDVEGAA